MVPGSSPTLIAIVDNQILPLLKQTFGPAFTDQEGESLKATLGDPDATPDEKMAQLDAFIDAKMRALETQERELGISPKDGVQSEIDALRAELGL